MKAFNNDDKNQPLEEAYYRNRVMRKRLIGHYMLLGIVVMVVVNLFLYVIL